MKYQHTPAASKRNAFCWDDGTVSIFLMGSGFAADVTGLTKGQRVSMQVQRITKATGRNPGTIAGLSDAGDKRLSTQVGW